MELSRVLPPTQTTKRGERAHLHGIILINNIDNDDNNDDGLREKKNKSLTKEKSSSLFAIAYVNEKSGKAYVRRVDDDKGNVVCEHQHRKITCVRPFIKQEEGSSSSFLCASGSADGSVHVWCAKTGRLKRRHERVLAGPIRDIAWSFDGSKLAVVGEGREVSSSSFSSSSSSFARCINAEMGTTVKDLGGATKACGTACASRSGKPHRVVTGSDDFRVRFYKGGPPFQLETIATMTTATSTNDDSEEEQRRERKRRQQNHRHEKYVNEVRMSEDDKYVLSASGDGIGVWDVETLEMIGDDGRVAAKDGSTYGVAWLDDKEHRFVSSGADKMVKLWNVKDVAREREVGVDVKLEILTATAAAATTTTEGETKTDGEEEAKIRLVVKPKMGRYVTKQVTREDAYSCCRTKTTTTTTTTSAKPSVDDMQIGVCASAKTVVSCGLSGTMTVFDVVDDDDDNDDEKKEGKKKRLRFREEILGHSRPITAMCSVDVSSSSMKKYQIWTASIQREDDPRPRILVCDYIPEKKTIENVEEVKENTPLKKITKLVDCGDTYVAAIGFDDHLRFASVANKAFIDDIGEECRVKFERQPIDVCVVSVSLASFSPAPPSTLEEKEGEEGEEEPRVPTVTKVQCELLVTFADARAQLVPIEYEKSSTEGGAGGLKILFDRIQRIDVTSTNSTTKRKKEVELSCGCAVQFFESSDDETTTTTKTKTLFAFGAANEAAVHIFERRNEDGIIEHKQTLERSNASSCNITCLDFAPNGKHLAVGDSNREIILYTSDKLHQSIGVEEEKEEEEEGEKFRLLKPRDRRHSKFLHGSRVEDLSWSRSSTSLLSCSLDGHAKIWRNVIVQNTTDSEDSVPKIESVDVNAIDGGARFARLLPVGGVAAAAAAADFNEKSEEESHDDLDTARAHLVCVGADCAVRFFAPASKSQKRI
jgi:WD40 repeat protein